MSPKNRWKFSVHYPKKFDVIRSWNLFERKTRKTIVIQVDRRLHNFELNFLNFITIAKSNEDDSLIEEAPGNVDNDYDPLDTFEGDVSKLMKKSGDPDEDIELIVYDDGKIRPRDYEEKMKISNETANVNKKVRKILKTVIS